jgi:MYXO-CTERM domain-containing protein
VRCIGITSTYPSAQPPGPINVQFTSATTSQGAAPPSAIGGVMVTGFGAAAASAGAWTYSAGSSSVTGTPGYGNTVGGTAAVGNIGSATHISLTAAAAPTTQGTPFTYVLTDNTGNNAYAAFNWSSFGPTATTIDAPLVFDPFFDPANVTSWNIVSGTDILPVTATLYGAAATSAQTDTVLDTFTVAIPPINGTGTEISTVEIAGYSNAQRSVQTLGPGPAAATIDGDGVASIAGANGGQIGFSYSDFEIFAVDQMFLRIDFEGVSNVDQLAIELRTANGLPAIGGFFSIPNSLNPPTFLIDLSLLSGYSEEFMAGVNEVFIIFGSTQPAWVAEISEIAFTSVPEPSAALLAMASLAGLALRRRR